MTSNASWRARPVFLSSTFKDMHAERDWLRHVVFPELAERLRERHCHLEPIDLRLGVETVELGSEEAKELQVLKVCLNEIDRSRPFLLVLLGDRYGWVPPESRMRAAAQEAGFRTDVVGKSVTALEIDFGILLKDPQQRRRCLFLFRDPLPYDQMPPEVAARYSDTHAADPATRAGYARLVALKHALESNPEFRGRVFRYQVAWDPQQQTVVGLEGFGTLVRDTLWAELDAETQAYALQREPTWEEREREALAEFVEHRSRDFTGRDQLVHDLLELARSPAAAGQEWAACVTSPPGLGKSALIAQLVRQLQGDAGVLLLAHAAGISSRGVAVDGMLRRWISELAEFLGMPNPLAENTPAEEVEQTFALLLARAAGQRRVVVLLDALNQFEPTVRARFLTWLPRAGWPANARLIATALPCEAAEALGERAGVRRITLPALSESESALIAQAVFARHHRQLAPEILAALLGKRLPGGQPAAGNPLWLTLAAEQINLLDEDDFARAERQYTGTAGQRLRAMVLDVVARMPADMAGLYGWLLEQAEDIHGAPAARAVAAAIAVSRFGWRESDLLALVPRLAAVLEPGSPLADWSVLRLAALRRAFRAHLVRRGVAEQWDYFHQQMREAVRQRVLADAERQRRAHAAAADYLESLPREDPLRQSELMVHLIGTDDRLRAAQHYGGDLTAGEESGATQALAAHVLAGLSQAGNPHLAWVTSLPQQPGLPLDRARAICDRFNFALTDALENEADLATRRVVLTAAERALTTLAAADPGNAVWQRDLAVSYYKLAIFARQGQDQATFVENLHKCFAVLDGMRRRGMHLDPPMAQLYQQLAGMFGGQ